MAEPVDGVMLEVLTRVRDQIAEAREVQQVVDLVLRKVVSDLQRGGLMRCAPGLCRHPWGGSVHRRYATRAAC